MHEAILKAIILTVIALLINAPAHSQRVAHNVDEAKKFQRDFLHDFYPNIDGKKYWMTTETASPYDSTPEENTLYILSIGDGPKYVELGCCVGGFAGPHVPHPKFPDDPFLGPWDPYLPEPFLCPRPAPPPTMELDSKGAWHPLQRLSLTFSFTQDGQLYLFNERMHRPPFEDLYQDFRKTSEEHPEFSDDQLRLLYKNLGFKYALGDKNAFEADLPRKKLEQYVGKITRWRVQFWGPYNDAEERLKRLKAFEACAVKFEVNTPNGEKKYWLAIFNPDGTLESLAPDPEPKGKI